MIVPHLTKAHSVQHNTVPLRLDLVDSLENWNSTCDSRFLLLERLILVSVPLTDEGNYVYCQSRDAHNIKYI